MSSLATPVALLIFNRPELTSQVFGAIARARPARLFIIADGPRAERAADVEKCAAARAVVERIDWPCEVIRNYSEVNLGCGRRVSSGLDWLFSQVEEAIILEDDCLPHPSFFPYCEELLARYRDDRRIMHISGDNFQRGVRRSPSSYYFSRIAHVWGWATWRRAWRHYDFSAAAWPEFKARGLVRNLFPTPLHETFWVQFIDHVYDRTLDTWDLQWVFACWMQGALSVMPEVNLISNIGAGAEATHTHFDEWYFDMPTSELGALIHPAEFVANLAADDFTMREVFGCLERPAPAAAVAVAKDTRLPARLRRLGSRAVRLLKGESSVLPYRRKPRRRAA